MNIYSANVVSKDMGSIMSEINENQPTDNSEKVEKEYINILLIGETGVGKSTFINAMANYISYKFINRLNKEKLHVLIPSIYKINDKDCVEHEVNLSLEHDKNEYLEVGASATQGVMSYDFGIHEGRVRVRIIDTPGMCDTRGIQQDEINCENIIAYMKHVGKINGICFLFKPTHARMTVHFEYCIMQILSRLDKSACKNFVFIFTNTRGSDYGPGDTLAMVQTIIEKIRKEFSDIDIPLDNNIFCFDNEAFRYLAAIEKNIKFDKRIEENYIKSWEFSAKQCWSLIRYLNQRITPYLPDNLITVNVARNMLIHLSKILAETSQLLSSSNFVLERLRDNRDSKLDEIEVLKKNKLDKVNDVEKVKLPHPILVCTNATCAQVYKVGPEYKWHYKVCHNECTEVQAEYEIIGSPELSRCLVIDKLSHKCLECNCVFSVHMQIDYKTTIKEGYVSNESVEKCISEKDEEIREFMKKIKDISSKNQGLKNELQIIQKFCAELAQFLKMNVIAPFSDSYKEYILYLINQKQILATSSNAETVEDLKTLIKNFEQTKKAFNDASEVDTVLSWQDIEDNLQRLFELPLNGGTIRTTYEQISKTSDVKINEYIHGAVFKKNENYNKKDVRNCNKPNKNDGKEISTKNAINIDDYIVRELETTTTICTRKLPKKGTDKSKIKTKTNEKSDKNKQQKSAVLQKGTLENLTVDELRVLLDEKLRTEKASNKKAKAPKHNESKKGGENTVGSRKQRDRTPPPPYSNQASASHYPPQYNYPHPSYSYEAPHSAYYQHHGYQGYNTNPPPPQEPRSGKTYEVTLKIPVPETSKHHSPPNPSPYLPPLMPPHPHMPPGHHMPPGPHMSPHPHMTLHGPPTYPHGPPTYPHAPPTHPLTPPPHYYNPGRPAPPLHGNQPSRESHQHKASQKNNKEQKSQNNDKNQKDVKKGHKGGKPQFKPKKSPK